MRLSKMVGPVPMNLGLDERRQDETRVAETLPKQSEPASEPLIELRKPCRRNSD